ncbi:rhamnogalacturonan lyase family protein [Fulvivirga sediminis]|uniref:RICIN domain-containing protein n=1 Tax=Fulvivirga sediminis TaxID=2803949 RepID=A0A937JZT3_9BACT|nr:RICIN domain-containing protein [Fulvivirga sediminis]MBL3655556.1 RICIN domain-containing protein [Fulvivirga sediminis]
MKLKLFNFIVLVGLFLANANNIHAQRYMENLNRGTVAVRTSSNQVLVSWRILGTEYSQGATYNLYRGSSLIASGLNVSNYVDVTSANATYRVAAVINGSEQGLSTPVSTLTNQYFNIPVRPINGGYSAYNINDASVGDLDGDGDYEIVIKRLANDATPSSTNYHYLEAYEMDGTLLWAINLGPNICNPVEVNFLVYDFDNDGRAEVATRTSDGMIDGTGRNIGDRDGDGRVSYRSTMVLNSSYYRVDGPDYISIFDGQSGREIDWDWYINREPMEQWGLPGMNDSQLGHRATKCMWAVAYLDGVKPSFVISRGIYHRIKMEAWDFSSGSLSKKWAWDSNPNGGATAYTGQGFHNLAAGDIDGDGRDEIIYGSMAVSEYGQGIYSTRHGHGDAGHLADINPNFPGLEFFSCLEGANGSSVPGLSLRSASNGYIQWSLPATGDIGRCMAADIDKNHFGMEIWGSEGSGVYSCTGARISSNQPTSAGGGRTYNFGVWWDGDVQRELLDRMVITKWNSSSQGTDRVATLYNVTPITDNNGTKSNPSLMADILGDWREEVIYPSSDQTHMVVFVTPHSTSQRMYTLMHDPNYRSAIAWQNNSYNQPPNLGFYFGGGMSTPPNPNIVLVGRTERTMSLNASAGNGAVNLNWTTNFTPSSSIQVMRDTDPDPAGRVRVGIVWGDNSYTDTDVSNGTTYYYWLKTYDESGNEISVGPKSATPFAGGVANGTYAIISKSSGKAMDVYDWSTSAGGNISQWEYWEGACQFFNLAKQTDGYYTIVSDYSGLSLEIADASTENGGNLQQWYNNGHPCQSFQFQLMSDGYYKIINKNSGMCLDLAGSDTQNGANIAQWTCHDNDNQRWELIPVSSNQSARTAAFSKNNEKAAGFMLYPNPSNNGHFIIQAGDSNHKIQSVEVYNMLGELVYHIQADDEPISVNTQLPKGSYIITINDGNAIVNEKLIVE